MSINNKSKGIEMILGISFIILGIFSLNRPITTLAVIVVGFGILSIARGIANIFGNVMFSEAKTRGIQMFVGVVDLLVGLIFITNLVRGAVWLGLLFAFWFLVECVGNLFLTARYSKKAGILKLIILLLDIICLILAIILIFNPLIISLFLPTLIGVVSILYGFIQFIQGLRIDNKL